MYCVKEKIYLHCCAIMPDRLAYIYFYKIDTGSNGKFTVNLQSTLSNKTINSLALSKNKQYCITNLRGNTVMQEDITKFKNYKGDIRKQSYLCKQKKL